jgi:3-hydroxybutyryl-CoA dehydratase
MSWNREFTIGPAQVQAFADLIGDHNPVHLDAAYAATTAYKQPICHGMLVASYISGCLVQRFGEGTIYLEQRVKFQRPVPVGSTIRVSFGEPQPGEKNSLTVPTQIEIQRGSVWKVVVDGSAVVQPGNLTS